MAEASIVTLLFTDLVRSTERIDRLGDDAAEEVRRTHFQLLRDAVTAHRGEEVKNLGDGLMVVFPSAVDAVGCAVAMQQSVRRHNDEHTEDRLGVRVGLHVGEPIHDESDYFGKPVVIAQRLCAHAEGGQIIASDLVRGLVGTRGAFAFGALGPLALKGLAEPLPACDVVWEPAEAPRSPLPPLLEAAWQTPLVGRSDSLESLQGCWKRVREGHREIVFLAGEPGIGKTRLAAEFARVVHAEGATVLFGRSAEETLIAYQPFVEGLQHYVTTCTPQALRALAKRECAELGQLVPDLTERLPDLPPPLSGDPEGQRYRLFDAVVALLANAGKASPVLLVLDDLHWADKPTLLLLRHIARAPEQPLLMLGTYRELELTPSHPLAEAIADLRRGQSFERLALGGLAEDDVNVLMTGVAGHAVPAEFSGAVHAQTEGNPFFIGEVVRHMVERGVLQQRDGRWTTPLPLDQLGIPEGVKDVIGQRLARLGDACNRALHVAAVVGREFDLPVLEHVSEVSGDQLLDALEEAIGIAVLEEVPGAVGRYSFVHALIRETLYRELTITRRVRLHRRIGEALETLHTPNLESHLGELAYHFDQAAADGDVDKAIDYADRAGDRAVVHLAYEEAVNHYQRALGKLDRRDGGGVDEKSKLDLLLRLGDTQWRAAEADDAREAFLAAVEIARRHNATEQLVRATLGFVGPMAGLGQGTINETAISLLEESLAALGEADSPARARVLARLADLLAIGFTGSHGRNAMVARQAVATARRIADPASIAYAIRHTRWALWSPDNGDERLRLVTEMIRLAKQVGDFDVVAGGLVWRSGELLEIGDIEEANREVEALALVADESRLPVAVCWDHLARGQRALLDGRFADAERLGDQILSLAEHIQANVVIHTVWAQRTLLRREQGRFAEVEPIVLATVERFPSLVTWRGMLAWLYSETGRYPEARHQYAALAANDFAAIPRDWFWMITLVWLSEVCVRLADSQGARALYDLLRPYAHRCALIMGSFCLGSVSRPLGLLATTMGRWEDAARHFEDALVMNERIQSPPWVAHTQHGYATMLLERNAPGDRDKAADLLTQALATAERLGMKALFGWAGELRRQAGP